MSLHYSRVKPRPYLHEKQMLLAIQPICAASTEEQTSTRSAMTDQHFWYNSFRENCIFLCVADEGNGEVVDNLLACVKRQVSDTHITCWHVSNDR